jgi:transposase-like protein
LKKFTKDNDKKSTKGDQKYKGWSECGKKFVFETVKPIKQEEDNGMQLKWEETYRQLLDVMMGAEVSEVDEDDGEVIKVDYSVLYEEV